MSSLWDRAILRFRAFVGFIYGTMLIHIGCFLPALKTPQVDMTGKNIIVTGGNSGIGYEICKQLAELGATVYIACRNASNGQQALDSIRRSTPKADVHVLELDTSSFASVRSLAEHWESSGKQLDVLVHNAGIPSQPKGKPYTADGFETVYQTNFLGPFLLTFLLECHLAPSGRVIFTTSHGSYGGKISSNFALKRSQHSTELGFHSAGAGTGMSLYSNTKLMQVAFARALQQHFRRDSNGKTRSANAFAPGLVATPIFGADKFGEVTWWKDPFYMFLKFCLLFAIPVEQGAKTGVFLAASKDKRVTDTEAGGYWDRQNRWISAADLMSQEVLDRLWVRWSADAGVEWL